MPDSNTSLEFFVSHNDTVRLLKIIEVEESIDRSIIEWAEMMKMATF